MINIESTGLLSDTFFVQWPGIAFQGSNLGDNCRVYFVSFFTEPLSFTAYFPASCKPLCDIVCLFFFFSGGRETSVPVILSWPETKILLFIFETVKTGLF